MAVTNQKLNPEVDTVCLMPSESFLFLSSRIVKEIARFGGDIGLFVPPLWPNACANVGPLATTANKREALL